MNLRSSSIIFNLLLACNPTSQHLHRTVILRLLVRQELECVDQVVTYSMCRSISFMAVRTILYYQDSVRIPPSALAATWSTPSLALLLLDVAVPDETHQM